MTADPDQGNDGNAPPHVPPAGWNGKHEHLGGGMLNIEREIVAEP